MKKERSDGASCDAFGSGPVFLFAQLHYADETGSGGDGSFSVYVWPVYRV